MDKNGFKDWTRVIAGGIVAGKPEDIAKFDPKAAELLMKFNNSREELVQYVKSRINKENN
jgi:hypothetical protein